MQNRFKRQHRTDGVCWCCCSPGPVRPCAYWASGLVKPLCKKCEKSQAVLKPRARN